MWINIKEIEPSGEVLAINDQKEVIVGYCHQPRQGTWDCENGGEVLESVTHYIPVSELINLLDNF